MSDTGSGFSDSLISLPQRIAGLVELLTTLDLRVRAALEGLEDMRRSVAPLETSMDELKQMITEKIEEVDLRGLGPRIDRLEAAILNIERATVHLDQSFQGGLELLPDFMTKRIKPTPES